MDILFIPFFTILQNSNKINIDAKKLILWTKKTTFSCPTPAFLQKVLGPIFRLPETLFTFSTSATATYIG